MCNKENKNKGGKKKQRDEKCGRRARSKQGQILVLLKKKNEETSDIGSHHIICFWWHVKSESLGELQAGILFYLVKTKLGLLGVIAPCRAIGYTLLCAVVWRSVRLSVGLRREKKQRNKDKKVQSVIIKDHTYTSWNVRLRVSKAVSLTNQTIIEWINENL